MKSDSEFIAFGIEIEGQISADLGLQGFVASLSQITQVEKTPSNPSAPMYSKWAVVSEPTIKPEDRYEVIELVSPIINSPEVLQSAKEVLSQIATLGFIPMPDTGGVHIHISLSNPSPLEILSFRILVSCLAQDLFDLFNISENRMKWIGTVHDLKSLSEKGKTIYEEMQKEYQNSQDVLESTAAKWRELQVLVANPFDETLNNKRSFLRFTDLDTIEIRGLNSTVDFDNILEVKNIFERLITIAKYDMEFVFDNLMKDSDQRKNLRDVLK